MQNPPTGFLFAGRFIQNLEDGSLMMKFIRKGEATATRSKVSSVPERFARGYW